MLIKIAVLIAMAVYAYSQGEPVLAGALLLGLIPGIGLLITVLNVVILLFKGWYGSAAIIGGLIAFNLLGNYYFKKKRQDSEAVDLNPSKLADKSLILTIGIMLLPVGILAMLYSNEQGAKSPVEKIVEPVLEIPAAPSASVIDPYRKGCILTEKSGPEAAALAGVTFNRFLLKFDAEYNAKLENAFLENAIRDLGEDEEKLVAACHAGIATVKGAIHKAAESSKKGRLIDLTPFFPKELICSYSEKEIKDIGGDFESVFAACNTSTAAAQVLTNKAAAFPKSDLNRNYTSSRGCVSGHWVDSVSDDGDIVKLEDGSVWEIAAVDTVDSMLWLPTTDIIACDDKLINTEDNETVEATRLK